MAELQIEIVYARADRQTVLRLAVPPGSTVQAAVERSGILGQRPPIDPPSYGIFGRRVTADHCLTNGDRIEIYRPLQTDPRDARRARVKSHRRQPD